MSLKFQLLTLFCFYFVVEFCISPWTMSNIDFNIILPLITHRQLLLVKNVFKRIFSNIMRIYFVAYILCTRLLLSGDV